MPKKLEIAVGIATIVGVAIAVIALIPAFGEWLRPRESSSTIRATLVSPTTEHPTPDGQLFSDNFDDGNANKWMDVLEQDSHADVQNGEYILNGSGFVYAGSNLWENYSVRAKVRLISGEGDFGIVVRVKNFGTLYICQHWKDEVWLNKYGVNSNERLDIGYYDPVPGESYDLKMDVQDQTISCYINGLEVAAAEDTSYTNGKFGFRIVNTKIAIDNVEVYLLP